jgi:hypothetical protein
MARTAGAALRVVAPEAAVASRATRGGRRSAADPRINAPGSKAAAQRDAIEAIKANRPPEPAAPETASDGPAPTSSGAGPSMPSLPAMPAAASTGSGFLLGVFAWAVGLAYLQGGSAGVKKFMAAKFFNKV